MKWEQYNIQPWILQQLQALNFINPTKIQNLVLQQAAQAQNLIVTSPTGSGKTLAFLLPILQKIDPGEQVIQAVIICPTRELAQQIYQVSKQLIGQQAIKVACLIGGRSDQLSSVQPQIVIGTVTRIKSLMNERKIKLDNTKILVVDECDMLFELGINDELTPIFAKMPVKVQKMAFSATIDQKLQTFFRKYWPNSQLINLEYQAAPPKVQHLFILSEAEKIEPALLALTNIINPFVALIFVNQQSEIATVSGWLQSQGLKTGVLHGQLSARERRQVFRNLQLNHYQYLVCTDIAARGIDLTAVTDVISLKLPSDFKYYWHRAGRTGRETAIGNSYVFCETLTQQQQNELKKRHISPKFYKIKQNQLVQVDELLNQTQRIQPLKSKAAIAAINQYKQQKQVKPGYKKSFKAKIAQIAKSERKVTKRRENRKKRG